MAKLGVEFTEKMKGWNDILWEDLEDKMCGRVKGIKHNMERQKT